eukprot:1588520-Amphidinium_carterae.1
MGPQPAPHRAVPYESPDCRFSALRLAGSASMLSGWPLVEEAFWVERPDVLIHDRPDTEIQWCEIRAVWRKLQEANASFTQHVLKQQRSCRG